MNFPWSSVTWGRQRMIAAFSRGKSCAESDLVSFSERWYGRDVKTLLFDFNGSAAMENFTSFRRQKHWKNCFTSFDWATREKNERKMWCEMMENDSSRDSLKLHIINHNKIDFFSSSFYVFIYTTWLLIDAAVRARIMPHWINSSLVKLDECELCEALSMKKHCETVENLFFQILSSHNNSQPREKNPNPMNYNILFGSKKCSQYQEPRWRYLAESTTIPSNHLQLRLILSKYIPHTFMPSTKGSEKIPRQIEQNQVLVWAKHENQISVYIWSAQASERKPDEKKTRNLDEISSTSRLEMSRRIQCTYSVGKLQLVQCFVISSQSWSHSETLIQWRQPQPHCFKFVLHKLDSEHFHSSPEQRIMR